MEYKKIVKLLSAMILGLLYNDTMQAASASNPSEDHAIFMQRQRQALAQSQVALAQYQANNPHLAPLAAQFLAQHAQTVQQLEQQILRQRHGDRSYTDHERLLARGQAHMQHSQSLMMPVLPKPTPASGEKFSVFGDSEDVKEDNNLFLPGASPLVKPATSRMPITPLIRPIPVRPAASAQPFGVTVHMAGIDPMGEDQNDKASLADYKEIYFRNMDKISMEMRPMLSPDYDRIQPIQDYDKAFMISGWTREELETKSIEELTSVIMKYQQEVRRENPLFGDSEDDDSDQDEDVLPLAPATRMPAMKRQVPGIALEVLERATAIPATATEAEEFVLVPSDSDSEDDDDQGEEQTSTTAASAGQDDDSDQYDSEYFIDFAFKTAIRWDTIARQQESINNFFDALRTEYLNDLEAIERDRKVCLKRVNGN